MRILSAEPINFVLTNWIPRRTLTRFMAWFSTIEQPVIRDLSMRIWQLFGGDLNLHEARKNRFVSVHECFIRELRDGARPIDSTPGTLVSPCDAIVGECGIVEAMQLVQAKGFSYSLEHLLLDRALAERYRNGRYVTLRLTSTMYHRFHAPADCEIQEVRYVPGDTWNVNPATLKRVSNVFCRNERAVITARLAESPHSVTLVPIAAILVGGIRLTAADLIFNLTYTGPERIVCRHPLQRGQEVGLFNHGSTVVVLVSPGFELCEDICRGHRIRVGEPLLRLESTDPMMPDVCNRRDT